MEQSYSVGRESGEIGIWDEEVMGLAWFLTPFGSLLGNVTSLVESDHPLTGVAVDAVH
jgi:hypothetical protein